MQSVLHRDYLIIGAGPAGLQLGYELHQQGRDYLILEEGDKVGTFYRTFPRHRQLLSINKVHTGIDDPEVNLRWDWNSLLCDDESLRFKHFSKKYFPSADDLVRHLEAFAEHYDLAIRSNCRIVHITRRDGLFVATDEKGQRFTANRLIMATGFTKMNDLPIPGIEHAESYKTVSVDPEDFINERVLIIGKGNSAFETADNLIETTAYIHVISPEPLSLAWKSRFVGHLRAVNNNFLDTYQLKCQNAVLDGIITHIDKQEDGFHVSIAYTHADGEAETQVYDRIIHAAGWRYDNSLFDDNCRPAMAIHGRLPEQTCEWESTTVPDLYFAGTVMQMRDFKKGTSSFIHGFRYTVRALSKVLAQKYHGEAWPNRVIGHQVEEITDAIIARVNKTSALWQQFGFLADLVALEDGEIRYYEEVPVDLIHEKAFPNEGERLLITLEFGTVEGDPFAIDRKPAAEHAERSSFLHPVIRHVRDGEVVGALHLLEDLHAEWDKPVHIEPLRKFLNERFSPSPV